MGSSNVNCHLRHICYPRVHLRYIIHSTPNKCMQVFADLEVHSKYARAVSSSMNVPTIAEWADKKGISLVGSGDFTHPMWFRELRSQLAEDSYGVYKLKGGKLKSRFLLTSEVSCIDRKS